MIQEDKLIINVLSENENYYFCQITDENGFLYDCSFRKLSNYLKMDYFNYKSVLETCIKYDSNGEIIWQMNGDINIRFTPALYRQININKNGHARNITFGYGSRDELLKANEKFFDTFRGYSEIVINDTINHKVSGLFYAPLKLSEDKDCQGVDLSEYLFDNYFADTKREYLRLSGEFPSVMQLDSSMPTNQDVLDFFKISRMGVLLPQLFDEQRASTLK